MVLEERIKWIVIDGRPILDVDLTDGSDEDGFAYLENTYSYLEHIPPEARYKPRALYNLKNFDYSIRLMRAATGVAKRKGESPYLSHTCYNIKTPIVLALSKLLSNYTKSKSRVLKTREEALQYLISLD